MFAVALAPRFALAAATASISDLTESPITVTIGDSVLLNNGTFTAPTNDPEKLTFSIASDGTATTGRGIAILKEPNGKVSDILDVTTTQGTRGGGIQYLSATATFTSDGESADGLDLSYLNLNAQLLQQIMDNGLVENGNSQDLGSRLINIDTDPGKPLSILSTIEAASDVPEPSSALLLGAGLLLLGEYSRRVKGKVLSDSYQCGIRRDVN